LDHLIHITCLSGKWIHSKIFNAKLLDTFCVRHINRVFACFTSHPNEKTPSKQQNSSSKATTLPIYEPVVSSIPRPNRLNQSSPTGRLLGILLCHTADRGFSTALCDLSGPLWHGHPVCRLVPLCQANDHMYFLTCLGVSSTQALVARTSVKHQLPML